MFTLRCLNDFVTLSDRLQGHVQQAIQIIHQTSEVRRSEVDLVDILDCLLNVT